MTFGDKLQALRKHHYMSQEALAEKMNISRATVSRWESGQTFPDIRQILVLCELLNVSVDYLVYDRLDDASRVNDLKPLRTLLWVCIAVNICGMVISMIGWLWVEAAFPVVLGMVMNILACVFLEVFQPKGIDKHMMGYTRRQFYAVCVWMFLLAPLHLVTKHYSSSRHFFLISVGVYLVMGISFTSYFVHKNRK